jgi:hypothetical protein
MSGVFQVESTIGLAVYFVLLAVKIFALGSALMYSRESYEAANKLTKTAWCVILGLGVVLSFVPLGVILNLVAAIAAFVYLADVRPALAGLTRRR